MSERNTTGQRRGFLKTLGLAGGAAVAASAPAAAFNADGSLGDAKPEKESADQRLAARYRETEDVKAFYRTNRY
ncbi:formate dehydrogenase region TAT target [Acetobacteraceae bacterium AT-5844]|nr:formate dehydrogenase region TAT target [Acetobacteraceae bacterium AT-5844]